MPYVEDYLDEEEMLDIGEEDDDFGDEDILEMLEEDDDWEEWDDEALEEWDDEALTESLAERRRRRYRRRRPKYRRRRRSYRPRYSPRRRVRGAKGAVVRTPAGNARVRFPKPVATQESVNRIVSGLKKDIVKNGAAIRKVDKTLDKNTATLDKKINSVNADLGRKIRDVNTDLKKGMQQMQQMMLMPMLLTKSPKLQTLKIDNQGNVTEQTYEAQDTMTMLLPFMMMSGGLGGTSGNSNMNMMMMALVLAEASKKQS